MTDLATISETDFLTHVVSVAHEFERRFNRDLGITGAFGEVHSAITWKMKRSTRVQQEGFDSELNGKKIQIKCGVSRAPGDTCSKVSMHEFDYLFYVHYNDNFKIIEAYLLTKKQVDDILSKKSGKRQLSLSQIRNAGISVTPGMAIPIK